MMIRPFGNVPATMSAEARPYSIRAVSVIFGLVLVFAAWCMTGTSPAFAQEAARPAEPAPLGVDQQLPEESTTPARKVVPQIPEAVQFVANWFFIAAFVFASMIAVWFAIERLVVLRRGRVIPRAFVDRFLQHLEAGKLDAASALELCEENGSPVAIIFAHGVRKWGKPSVEIEQATIDGGERQVAQLRKHLRVINGVATITPLVGLLGTVWGMILAFSDIASRQAMGREAELAAGIVLALLTTAAGLSIAIPSLVFYMYLAGRVDTLVMEMDHLAQNVVYLISAEGLSSRANRPSLSAAPRGRKASPPAKESAAEKKAV